MSTHLRQITLSQLYFCANIRRVGSMVPPRRPARRTNVTVTQSERRETYVRLSARYFPFGCCSRIKYDHLKMKEMSRRAKEQVSRSLTFQLFSSKNQTLLIGRNSFLILDFCLDIFNGVRRFDLREVNRCSSSFNAMGKANVLRE